MFKLARGIYCNDDITEMVVSGKGETINIDYFISQIYKLRENNKIDENSIT